MNSSEYKSNLRRLISYIKGNRKALIVDFEKDMKIAAENQDFESAAKIRNRIQNLKELQRRIVFGDKEFLDINKDRALNDLVDLLDLKKIPTRIEGFDISHMSGTNVVASMVVFKNGVSDRSEYRKFKIHVDRNDDFYNMSETLTRRLSEKNIKSWGKPSLILIDGGKGQLDAAIKSRGACGQNEIPFIGLAKRDEQIVVKFDEFNISKIKVEQLGGSIEFSENYLLINLPKSSAIIKLLQRIRDESHRFAVSYHTVLKRAKQTESILDGIPGIGAKTRTKLIRHFGSARGVARASNEEISKIIGKLKAEEIYKHIK